MGDIPGPDLIRQGGRWLAQEQLFCHGGVATVVRKRRERVLSARKPLRRSQVRRACRLGACPQRVILPAGIGRVP